MEVLGLILARGGSKRLPGKNISSLGGKPLLYYTIDAAYRSHHITRIVVSTDSQLIATVAKRQGADVPFMRPDTLSGGMSTEYDAVVHALTALKELEGYEPDVIVKLSPTTPFRQAVTIDRGVELLYDNQQVDSVRAVRKCREHPCKMWKLKDGRVTPFVKSNHELHTLSYQMLPEVYVNAASFDVLWPRTVYTKRSVTGTDIIPLVMDEDEAFDVNTRTDLVCARAVLEEMRKHGKIA